MDKFLKLLYKNPKLAWICGFAFCYIIVLPVLVYVFRFLMAPIYAMAFFSDSYKIFIPMTQILEVIVFIVLATAVTCLASYLALVQFSRKKSLNCKDKSVIYKYIIPINVCNTLIVCLILGIVYFNSQLLGEYETDVERMLHLIIPDFALLIPKCFSMLGNIYIIIALVAICAVSSYVDYLQYIKASCKKCGFLKGGYSSYPLRFPVSAFDALKTENRDLSVLENLEIGSPIEDHGKIDFTLCDTCKEAVVKVRQILQQKTSDGKRTTLSNTICENVEVDYDWAKKLIAYYKEKVAK